VPEAPRPYQLTIFVPAVLVTPSLHCAACEAPNALEIYECIINGLKLEAEAEMKSYPRDWLVPGRVRVRLRRDDGVLANPDIPSRELAVLNHLPPQPCCKHVPCNLKEGGSLHAACTVCTMGSSQIPAAAHACRRGAES
jgi:hypothetical protein